MKKMVSVMAALAAVFCLFACAPKSPNPTPGGDTTTYTVTFKQEGESDVVKSIEEGKTLTDIPTPKAVTGYTVEWEDKDLSNIKSNIIVNAVKTPNSYTITFELNNADASLESETLAVTYDAEFTLPTPQVHGTKQFTKWVIKGTETEFTSGVYRIADNLTLTAVYDEWTENY